LLSEHEAYNRIEAARVARRFPVILELLGEGAVNLTSVRLLAPHLTSANHVEVLQSARGLRRAQVEELVARLVPRPDVPATMRKLPAPKAAGSQSQPSSTSYMAGPATPHMDGASISSAAAPPLAPPSPAPVVPVAPTAPIAVPTRATISALSPDRYKMQLTISGDILQKLRRAKDLLRHAVPSGDEAMILDRALTALLADVEKKKHAKRQPSMDREKAAVRPRRARAVALGSRRIPAEVKRAVCERDGGTCAFIGITRRRCQQRAFIEFHHVQSYVDDGAPTVENIELRCRAHNAYEWQQRCGDRVAADAVP
jgi:hypothetical protein